METPIKVNHGINALDGRQMIDVGRYQQLVGKLIYLSPILI